MQRPTSGEFNTYFQKYIGLVGEGDFDELLQENTKETLAFFNSIDVTKHNYKYAENKWTIKDVLMHIIDTERGFSYRAIICIRKDDKTPLYPMDEDFFAANVSTTDRSMESLLEEFLAVRKSFSFLFQNTTDEHLQFIRNNNGHPISARALGYIGIGHILHHLHVIKERYL